MVSSRCGETLPLTKDSQRMSTKVFSGISGWASARSASLAVMIDRAKTVLRSTRRRIAMGAA
ncbi:hypothetical protein MSG_01987 [Mycobacterium shigaense]|uniref:Uncharacterized protein n=1 Tax=Mycobacterium shigaense TaxID=722731 RepID=A0A1Z4EGU0_9MYCO|nr:hypothetical protein MSG_01987 [Mycobacterium shigaense]